MTVINNEDRNTEKISMDIRTNMISLIMASTCQKKPKVKIEFVGQKKKGFCALFGKLLPKLHEEVCVCLQINKPIYFIIQFIFVITYKPKGHIFYWILGNRGRRGVSRVGMAKKIIITLFCFVS